MCVLLGVLRNSGAIPIMNPLSWFMIFNKAILNMFTFSQVKFKPAAHTDNCSYGPYYATIVLISYINTVNHK